MGVDMPSEGRVTQEGKEKQIILASSYCIKVVKISWFKQSKCYSGWGQWGGGINIAS